MSETFTTTVKIIMGKIDDPIKRPRIYRALDAWAGEYGGTTTIDDSGKELIIAAEFADAEKAGEYASELSRHLKSEN